MNILFVANGLPDRNQPMTGFPTYLFRVSQALAELGHRPVILCCGMYDHSWIDRGIEIVQAGCIKIRLSGKGAEFIINSYIKSFVLNRKISELGKKIKFDIIQFTSLEGTALLYSGKTPSVMRLSSYAKTYFSTYETYPEKQVKIMAWIERQAARRCNAVFAPCTITAEAFGRDIKRKVHTIETPFVDDVSDYDEACLDTVLKDKKYALFFGTLYAEKGIKVIAMCLEKFLAQYSDYYFVFAGKATIVGGENAIKLLKRSAGMYADRVITLPELGKQQLYPIIKAADFVTLPSLMDNLPNACIEAMNFGKVVIGTDGSSFEQLITHGKSGLLCRIGDSDDLYSKMQIAASMNIEEKERIGRRARGRIERMKPEIVVAKLLRLYEYIISRQQEMERIRI